MLARFQTRARLQAGVHRLGCCRSGLLKQKEGPGTRDAPRGLASPHVAELPAVRKRFADPASPAGGLRQPVLRGLFRPLETFRGRRRAGWPCQTSPRDMRLIHADAHPPPPALMNSRTWLVFARALHASPASTPRRSDSVPLPSMRDGCTHNTSGREGAGLRCPESVDLFRASR